MELKIFSIYGPHYQRRLRTQAHLLLSNRKQNHEKEVIASVDCAKFLSTELDLHSCFSV